MGRWVEVRCNCPDRGPINRPDHQNTTVLFYPCGHKDGALAQTSPNDFFEMARFLRSLLRHYPDAWEPYEVFQRLERWPKKDEDSTLSVDEAKQWQLELEELKRIQDRTTDWSFELQNKWHTHWKDHELKVGDPTRVVSDVIDRALKLCQASVASGNPIEFYW